MVEDHNKAVGLGEVFDLMPQQVSSLNPYALRSTPDISPPTRPAHRLLAEECTFVRRGKGAKFYETRTARTVRPQLRKWWLQ